MKTPNNNNNGNTGASTLRASENKKNHNFSSHQISKENETSFAKSVGNQLLQPTPYKFGNMTNRTLSTPNTGHSHTTHQSITPQKIAIP